MPDCKNEVLLPAADKNTEHLPVNINLDDYYSLKEVCYMFNRCDRTILNWRNKKKLIAIEYNGHVLFEKVPTDIALERFKRLGFL